MSAAPEPRESYREAFHQVRGRLPGRRTPWLRELREHALERFLALGLPSTRDEAWRYTDLRALERRRFVLAEDDGRITEQALLPYLLGEEAGHRLVFVNGRFAPRLSRLDRLPSGVSVSSLGEALAAEAAMLEAFLGRQDEPADGFAALNTAFLNDGAYIRLGHGVVLDEPLHVFQVRSGPPDTLAVLRNLLVADEGSQASVIESHLTLEDGGYLTNSHTQVVLAKGAALEHYLLGQEHLQSYRISRIQVHQDADSRYVSHNLGLGGLLTRNELDVVLDGEGAECTLNGLYLLHGRQHLDNHTRIEHRKPRCTSREWYKGVLDARARGVFSGRILVCPEAQKTDAEQANHNLLLSRDAEADTMPQLEIYADDVKCAHGATVGELDREALFYLRSRGLARDEARALLVYAFASDMLERIGVAPLRHQLEHAVRDRLLHGAGAGVGP